ncbi:hypothetical protein HK101_004494 [Irineochytrium annulatum]|nr:hypothetical protein HK101_004494 [Irineochytrium annulatum]
MMIINTEGAAINDPNHPATSLSSPTAANAGNGTPSQSTGDIVFPQQIEDLSQIAIDIGGSLAKVVWFEKAKDSPIGGRLNFQKFETQRIEDVVQFVKQIVESSSVPVPVLPAAATPASEEPPSADGTTPPVVPGKLRMPTTRARRLIKATGGGAHKFHDLLKSTLGPLNVTIHKEDEMESLITGLNFLVRQIPDEVFTFDERRGDQPLQFERTPAEIFPYMLVNIGSGVSILKVTSDETYERVSGTSLGGGTLWGLLSLLTTANGYDDMLELSKRGDNKNVDMLVGDIYGGDYPKIGLKASTIASSFGKVFRATPEERKKFKEEDISRSLLYLVSNNIGQIAYLNAQAHGINNIYFSGFFIRGHPVTMNTLNYAINFWSKGKIKALFLRHEGYLGAMGAFLRHSPRKRLGSFTENFSQIHRFSQTSPLSVGALETFLPSSMLPFPLLHDLSSYNPDTSEMTDPRIQHYWIDLLGKNLHDLVEMVIGWQGGRSRAEGFESLYRDHLARLRKEPNAYGALSVRSLLNLREQCLREMGFTDVFEGVKREENAAALAVVGLAFREADEVPEEGRLRYLTDNVLAGNMFDWGSTSVQEMLKRGELEFRTAKSKIGFPAKYDSLEKMQARMGELEGGCWRKVMIFVDNSGADVILGILPFARYLLTKGSEIVLAANTRPSVNDVTAYELEGIVEKVAETDEVVKNARTSRILKVVGTGSASPCIDLRRISDELAAEAKGVDLVVLEGMGRAIHTNFFAKFAVDCLKIGVFKNPQAAIELEAQMYDGIRIFKAADTTP